MFEGEAAAQIFAEVLGRNFGLPRKPAGGRAGFRPSELEGRQGSRVLPDSFDVVDDPTQHEWRGKALFGSYDVDREGVLAQPVTLVEKGVLKGFLLTRQPVKGLSGSNGHARLPGPFGASTASIGNLFVRSSEGVPVAELKKKLIAMVQARGKPYGILVRKMDFPSAGVEEMRRLFAGASGGAEPISSPVLVYKVFADGHEELIRDVRLRGFSARSLKDIEAAGDDATVFEFMDSTYPMAMIGAASFTSEACVVAPSFLIDDVELRKNEEELPKLPVVPPPEMTR
jgi:predicted Zn-dependent protease